MRFAGISEITQQLKNENFYWKIGFYALILAGLVHGLFLLVFAAIGLLPMALFNIGSVALYGVIVFALGVPTLQSKDDRLIGWLVYGEILAHNVAATFFLGREAGFDLYLFLLVGLPFFIFSYSRPVYLLRIVFASFVILVIELCPCFADGSFHGASHGVILSIRAMNVAVFLFTLVFLSYLYTSSERQTRERLTRDLYRDPLTGLYNRRYTSKLLRKWRYEPESLEKTALILMDLDHFKRLNDRYGHDCGDEALKRTAEALQEALYDVVAFRWGGEEFLLVLDSVPDDEVLRHIAERIRSAVAAKPIECPQGEIPFTASIGATRFLSDDSFYTALTRADKALYRAKETGRDRVIVL
ncbi:GGDEF domain-containing protein [Nitratifractor sp.]